MTDFDPAWPHGELREVFPDIFMVTGTNKVHWRWFNYQFSRNMQVLREGDELTLVNTVRLNDAGLAQLEQLGTVKHVVRIGAFHGRDDPFYLDRYGCAYWAIPGMHLRPNLSIDQPLVDGSKGPISDSVVHVLDLPKQKEAVLLLKREGGILISCDSLQTWTGPDRYFNLITKLIFWWQKQFGSAHSPDPWRKACHPDAHCYENIAALEFKHLLSAHGEPLRENAKQHLLQTIAQLKHRKKI